MSKSYSNGSIVLLGRKRSTSDDKLLDHANMDGLPPAMEHERLRRYWSHQDTIREGLEARHHSIQQVSVISHYTELKKKSLQVKNVNVSRKTQIVKIKTKIDSSE